MQATPRFLRVAPSICLALLLTACGSDGPNGPPFGASLSIVLGAGLTDTVDTQPLQALVVEVRGHGGALAESTVVRFEAQAVGDPTDPFYEPGVYVCVALPCALFANRSATDTTDAVGRATVGVRLGHKVGQWVVRVTVPELGLAASSKFTVTPGAPAAVRALFADTALDIGATATVRGRVVDRYDNVRTESTTLTAGSGSAVTVDAATSTVTARDMGTQWVFPRHNALFDSTRVRVLPSGRLVVWSGFEQVVRLVDVNGKNERTVVSNVWSSLGAFPQFDPTRRRVTLQVNSVYGDGWPDNVIVVDTTGTPRRDVGPAIGFSAIMATRQLADGTVLVVGARTLDPSHPDYSLWRVATDNTITFLAYFPDLGLSVGGADISHTGTKVAYSANTATYPPELYVLDIPSGTTTLIDANGYSPRWSAQDDRVAYLAKVDGPGVAMVANADGTERRGLGSALFGEGLAWSPDGTYVVGRAHEENALRVLRVRDGAEVMVFFRSATGFHDYGQPDWR